MMWGEMKCCRFLWAVEELVSLRPAPSREGEWCATDMRAGAQRDPALACLRKERDVPVNESSCTGSPAVRWVLGGRGIPWDLRLPSGQTCPAVPSVQPLRPSPVGWSGLVNPQSLFWSHLAKSKHCEVRSVHAHGLGERVPSLSYAKIILTTDAVTPIFFFF